MRSSAVRGGLLGVCLLAFASVLHAGNVELTSIEVTVDDLDRAAIFFTETLQFTQLSQNQNEAERTATLRLGEETLVLSEPKVHGQPVPANMLANDRRFQHIAIVVTDIDVAYRRLLAGKAAIVSHGPQTLPSWNYDAAGIRALYFRDPDGHFLELIQYPDNKGEPKWHRRNGRLFLGIDHSAIVVGDLEASVHFYRDALGLTLTGRGLNYGVEQEQLNGIPGSEVKIASLRGAKGPGIELLQYVKPGIVDSSPDMPAANDGLHWQIDFAGSPVGASRPGAPQHDPDGHALHFNQSAVRSYDLGSEALKQHWPRYVMEGAQLGIFMIVTLYLTLALEHPTSPLRRALPSALLRRMVMGLGIGGAVVLLIYCDWGRLSGAQFNPSVTLAFLSLGRIEPWDAFFYVLAQFIGGWLGLTIAVLPVRRAAARKQVNVVLTQPGELGTFNAFVAEFCISFVLMFSLLQVFHEQSLKPWIGFVAGLLLWSFISFEAPLSGMSLNPARSAASALVARDSKGLWIYLVAPPLAMLLAAQLCRLLINS